MQQEKLLSGTKLDSNVNNVTTTRSKDTGRKLDLETNKQAVTHTQSDNVTHHSKPGLPVDPRDEDAMSNISQATIIKYNFSGEIKFHNPPIESYLNIKRARKYVLGYTHFPSALEGYTVAVPKIPFAPAWDTDTGDLDTLARVMLEGVRYGVLLKI